MSKDSNLTYLHMHQPRLADLFEEFIRPHTSTSATAATVPQQITPTNPQSSAYPPAAYGPSTPATIPSFLPIEDIYVQPQYQPPNPEDEDDVVPDQHAAYGITRAMERRREPMWRDLGLETLVNGHGLTGSGGGGASVTTSAIRVKSSGKKMGGRRTICLR
ncbi:hypothetical protein N7495_006014 [Penicillium taxi]|uniref:uncharacterized protein n=1 Tax=Penicillium taxi TaxID=168475 RepID=UPI002545668F|nr:uncharacterized protein N7495_006014 [Penicillium taxi]KAJ5894323.1 hypothetical protein N7495_006014 [Penicillium taxi]